MREVAGASAQTRQRVLKAAAELGYRPDSRARLLARNRTQLLGVMFNTRGAFNTDLVEGIYGAAEPARHEVILSAVTPDRDERRALDTLLGYRCEALILIGPEIPSSALTELSSHRPVIVIGRQIGDTSIDVVRTSDDEGMRQAVSHLMSLGHQEILHIDGGHSRKSTVRRRGYRTAMRRYGLDDRARVLPGGRTVEAGAAAAALLLKKDTLPTAILAFDDDCALGLLDSFVRAGIAVPDDLSVVGYDDSRLARLPHINLTTIGQDANRMASLAVERALARLAGQEITDRELVLSPHLVVRSTTAAVRT
jgi:DNA-binding LacI/PurR family transcriptional regulator